MMLDGRRIVKVVSSLVVGVSLLTLGATVNADEAAPKLTPAETVETNPVAKKGQKIFVPIQDTKKQTVPVVNQKNIATGKQVKMGTTWTVKATKKVRGKRIYRIGSQKQWLRSHDVVKK